VRQHGWERTSGPAPRFRPSDLAIDRPSRRAMRRTDFCLLTFLVRALAPRRLPAYVVALARCASLGDSPSSRKSDSLRWVTRRRRWAFSFPSRHGITVPLTPLSQLPRCAAARADNPPSKAAKTVFEPTRVKRCELKRDPRCLPSSKDPRPAAFFRIPGSGLPQVRGLATATLPLVASFASARSCELSNARSPSTCPFAMGNHASMES